MRLIVIGGGAAGFFCAVNAARINPALEVIIVEKSNKILSKVRISGGGRCNVTHACFSIPEMSANYPRGANFVKKCFHQFFTTDTIKWFEERGVPLKTEKDGRMFPVSDSSQSIIDCLLNEVNKYGIRLWMNQEVKSVDNVNGKWQLNFTNEQHAEADFICVATGGYPKSSMFQWLKLLGHTIEDPVPSLFTFNIPANPISGLMGISVPQARLKVSNTKLQTEGPVLITHWGLSGPAVLRLSAWGARELNKIDYHFDVLVNWVPGRNEQELQKQFIQWQFELASQKIVKRNPYSLPNRLWNHFLQQCEITEDLRWADISAGNRNKLIHILTAQKLAVRGKTTYKEEFVTAGGISLGEINPQTMESRMHPRLYFAGEVMNVDGITGGFNFQHAWTTGFIAGSSIAAIQAV